ncbi:MAG: methylmalonyl Co-A mutase-associated GTPase MeaB [Terriglobia bacterium]
MTGSCEELAEAIQKGDRRAVARAISGIESGDESSVALLKRLFVSSRRSPVIGLTGSPGTGKSTLVEKLAAAYRRRGLRVGILAVDPTSPFSGGAILGDRIRMQSLAVDSGIYIRSMATRGLLGGLAPGVWDAVVVLEACGCDLVIIETVGIGQDEIEIARLADVTVLLLVPGAGDSVQAFKAGVMEIADVFVINKSDAGDTGRTAREIAAMLEMAANPDGWRPPLVRTVATTGEGVDGVLRAIDDFRVFAQRTAVARQRTEERWRRRIFEMLRRRLIKRVNRGCDALIAEQVEQICGGRTDPYSVAEELIRNCFVDGSNH